MRKINIKVVLALGLVSSCAAIVVQVLAQAPNASTETSDAALQAIDTFSARGSIASLIFDTPTNITMAQNTSGTVMATSLLPAKTFILTGSWRLKVDAGNVTAFDAKFTKVHIDGTNRHTHQFSNFYADSIEPVRLNANGTTVISGTVDVALNGVNAWTKVKTTILIYKLSTITISLDPKDTVNHFKGQSIYGAVNLLLDKHGRHLTTFPHP